MTWLSRFFHRRKQDAQLDSELRFHVEQQTAENIAAGMNREEARRRALAQFGGLEYIKEETRDARGTHFVESLLQDIRFGLRMLRKSPGFTVVAVLTLALGIGANTAIFSVAYAVLFRPLPYPHSSQLVTIGEGFKFRDAIGSGPLSKGIAQIVENQHEIFASVATYEYRQFILTGSSEPSDVRGIAVTGSFFSLLGVHPLLGRPILPQDSQPDRDAVAVLAFRIWQSLFGGNPGVIGRTITLNDKLYRVVGVMPPRFEFPWDDFGSGSLYGLWTNLQPALDTPAAGASSARVPAAIDLVARLNPRLTLKDAQAQLHTLAATLVASHSFDSEHFADLDASSWEAEMAWHNGSELLILLGAVGFVLLIACVNVSAMLLGRSWSRRGEVAIRTALGATRPRLMRQVLTESILLSLAGGTGGLLFSLWGIRMIRLVAPTDMPRLDQIGLDPVVLWFALGISIMAGILFGLVPALHVSDNYLAAALKGGRPGSPSVSSGGWPRRLRNALVIVEVALAVVLVTGAALMAGSLEKLARLKFGWRTDHVLTMEVNFSKRFWSPANGVAAVSIEAVQQVLSRVSAIPGVESVADTEGPPLGSAYEVRGRMRINNGAPTDHPVNIAYFTISPGYFRTMGIRLLQGRDFDVADNTNSPRVVIVNQAFVRRYLSGNPLAQRFSPYDDQRNQPQWSEIVGVAADSIDGWLYSTEPEPAMYEPFAQAPGFSRASLVIRTSGDPMALVPAIRERVWSVDKDAPITEIRTIRRVIADEEAGPRFHTVLLGSFGALGLLLAMIGVYGVISYTVARRTHEIGVRIALGAHPRDILRMVLGEGMLLAIIGILVGVIGALALTRFLRSLLFEIKPTDPATFISVALLLALVALAACYIPARRAMRVDPMVALRYE